MYDDLIQRLHRYTENCVAYKLDADFASAVQEAADAIEELSKENESLGKDLTSAVEMLKKKRKPKWIPVTDRLPEDGQKVLALEPPYGESSRYYYSIVYFVTNLEKVDEYDFQGKNRNGFCSLDSEWGWCEHCKVVYWMPLPEPPKESES